MTDLRPRPRTRFYRSCLLLVGSAIALSLMGGCALRTANQTSAAAVSEADASRQVAATERAFARTMADRDVKAFAQFLADEAIFFSGSTPLRGKKAIVEAWTPYFATAQASFSWEPESVEVLESGNLAFSSGPVRDASGNVIATFTSIWRLESPGKWRLVFDKGNDACRCPQPQPQN